MASRIKAGIKPILLNMDQVAEMLNVTRSHLYRRMALGLMPKPVRLGRSVRWRVAEMEAWVAAGCPETGGESK